MLKRNIHETHLEAEKVAQFLSYVPKMVALRFSGNRLKSTYEVTKFPCAVLFVDISGFTSLNEQYAKLAGGIERVTKHINGYFGQLVQMIESHGGDVLKFAGDALIVAFGNEKDPESTKAKVLRATQCGIQIQSELKEYDAEGIRLTLHIAVGAGDLYTFHLGGIDARYEFFPAGDCFGQISNALDKSKSGQVYLSQQAWDIVKDVCEGTENEGDYHVTKINTPIVPVPLVFNQTSNSSYLVSFLRRYIDKGIQKRIDAGQAEYLAEMRRVSVVFINLKGLQFQAKDDHHHPHPVSSSSTPTPENAPKVPSENSPTIAGESTKKSSPKKDPTTEEEEEYDEEEYEEDEEDEDEEYEEEDSQVPSLSLNPSDPSQAQSTEPIVGRETTEEAEIEEASLYDYAELNTVLKIMQKVVFRHEGFVRQFLLDDKAVFGVPTAHTDDPIRAVSAAIAIQNQLSSIGLQSFIGVTTGQAFCGTVGSSVRQEYAVVGDIVNLSARLMVASYKGGHGLLCDENTQQFAKTRYNCVELPAISVKGKKDPIKIFIPQMSSMKDQARRSFSASLDSSFRGRTEEKTVIMEAVESLAHNMPSFAVLCEGEAGVGKSRLGEELAKLANEKYPGNVFIAGGDAIDNSMPFLAFSFLFIQMLNLGDDRKANENIIKEIFAKIADPEVRNDCFSHAALLNELFELEFPRNKLVNTLADDQEATIAKMTMIFKEILTELTKTSPKILLIEDAQWLDVPSWGLILEIVRQVTSIIFFIAMRPIPFEKRNSHFSQLLENSNTCRIKLQPLSSEDILQIVRDEFGIGVLGEVPNELAHIISEKAQGNPFFAKEILKGLETQKVIGKSADGKAIQILTPLAGADIPGNLQNLVMANFDKLQPTQQMVLKVGSVLGKVIHVEVLEAIYPDQAKLNIKISQEVTQLKKQQILADNKMSSDTKAVMFTSTLFCEVAYNMMLNKHRTQLHKEAAEYYEKKFQESDCLVEFISLLTFHFEKAELKEKAEEYRERFLARSRWKRAIRLVSTIGVWQSIGGGSSSEAVHTSPTKKSHKKKRTMPKLAIEEHSKVKSPKREPQESLGLSANSTSSLFIGASTLGQPKDTILSKLKKKLPKKPPVKKGLDEFTKKMKHAEELVLDSPRNKSPEKKKEAPPRPSLPVPESDTNLTKKKSEKKKQ